MNRKQRESNRNTAERLRRLVTQGAPCVNCGEPGQHFIPPCLDEPGWFVCDPKRVTAE